MLPRCLLSWCPALFLLGLTTSAQAQWGHFKGRIVVDRLPALKPLAEPGMLPAAPAGVPDEKLVVDPKTSGVANVLIYPRVTPTPVHPDLEKAAIDELVVSAKGMRLSPRVVVARTDQEILIKLSDPAARCLRGNPLRNPAFVSMANPSDTSPLTFEFANTESMPFWVNSACFPWMDGYWLIVDHPYTSVSNAQGEFEIRNLPVGEHKFRIWHETKGYLDKDLRILIEDGQTVVHDMNLVTAELLSRP